MSSNFGERIKISIFGQSHSEAIGVVIDGLPAGEEIDLEKVQAFMKRRHLVSINIPPQEKREISRKWCPVYLKEKHAARHYAP